MDKHNPMRQQAHIGKYPSSEPSLNPPWSKQHERTESPSTACALQNLHVGVPHIDPQPSSRGLPCRQAELAALLPYGHHTISADPQRGTRRGTNNHSAPRTTPIMQTAQTDAKRHEGPPRCATVWQRRDHQDRDCPSTRWNPSAEEGGSSRCMLKYRSR